MKLIILRGKTSSGKSTLQELHVKHFIYANVEIEKIKIKTYGNTQSCDPIFDFKLAGLNAKIEISR